MSAPHNTPADQHEDRRSLMIRISVLLGSIIGAIMTLPTIGFMLAPIFRRPRRLWRPVGRVEDFEIGATVLRNFEDPSPEAWAGVTAKTGSWVRRVSEDQFIAFSINCRHLGCPVRWVEGPRLFMCPCHGGVYYSDGTVAGGPPPEPLHRYNIRVRDGQVEIQTGPIPLTTTPLSPP